MDVNVKVVRVVRVAVNRDITGVSTIAFAFISHSRNPALMKSKHQPEEFRPTNLSITGAAPTSI